MVTLQICKVCLKNKISCFDTIVKSTPICGRFKKATPIYGGGKAGIRQYSQGWGFSHKQIICFSFLNPGFLNSPSSNAFAHLEPLQPRQIGRAPCQICNPLQQPQPVVTQPFLLSHHEHIFKETVYVWDQREEGVQEVVYLP